MIRALSSGCRISVYVLIAAGLLLLFFTAGVKAQETWCDIRICVSIPGLPPPNSKSDIIFFDFAYVTNSETGIFDVGANAGCINFVVEDGSEASLTELQRQSWDLESVNCESEAGGLAFSPIENGVNISCLEPLATGTCTFVNQRASVNIPTMSEWGMIGVASALGLIGVFYAVRRRRAEA